MQHACRTRSDEGFGGISGFRVEHMYVEAGVDLERGWTGIGGGFYDFFN